MLTIAYSGVSRPSALKIANELNNQVLLRRDSTTPADVNWGRYKANSTLNPDISNVTNKRVMRQLFNEHGVPMPRLITVSPGGLTFDQPHMPMIGRPDRHTKGRGYWKCYDWQDVMRALRGTKRKKAATHFMEFIESDREYRVHVFKGKSIRISEKVFNADGSYTTGKPGDIKLRNVRAAAKRAVEAVGLDFGAVDILARGANNDEVFVLEVNASPGLGGSMPALYAKIFKEWKRGEF